MDKEIARIKEALSSTDVRSTSYDELLNRLHRAVDTARAIDWYESDKGTARETTCESKSSEDKRARTVADILSDPVVEQAPPLVEVPKEEPKETEPVEEKVDGPITKEALRELLTDTKDRVEKTTIKAILQPYVPEGKTKFSFKDVPEDKYEELAEALRNAR